MTELDRQIMCYKYKLKIKECLKNIMYFLVLAVQANFKEIFKLLRFFLRGGL